MPLLSSGPRKISPFFIPSAIINLASGFISIRYRARGGVWRYAMGKNMWKFDFNRGHYFQARDDYGKKYKTKWDKLNFSACIQQGDYLYRGEQGMFEAAGYKMFNLVGVEAPKTNWVQFKLKGTRSNRDAAAQQ